MNSKVRKLIYEPLVTGQLHAVVPDFSLETDEGLVTAPASLSNSTQRGFVFNLHFLEENVPSALRNIRSGTYGREDRLKITGQIEGEVSFSRHVFPPSQNTTRTRGTSTATVTADRLHLDAEGTDLLTQKEMSDLLGSSSSDEKEIQCGFRAHLIFHGPRLHLLDSGTKVVSTNDFMGESSSSSFDTHQFSGAGWEAALIQDGEELHLHIRNQSPIETIVSDPVKLVERIAYAVAFTHGFRPWPVYQEIRINHRIVERWLSSHFNLEQSTFAPVSERLGFSGRLNNDEKLRCFISSMADGLGKMPPEKFHLIKQLVWNVVSSDTADLPPATHILIICSALDGLMKVIGGDKKDTLKEWKSAANETGLSWEGWLSNIMETRKKHRDHLSHGRFWILEEISNEAYFEDYPQLGSAFMAMIAAYCGYNGPVVTHPLNGKVANISDLKVTDS